MKFRIEIEQMPGVASYWWRVFPGPQEGQLAESTALVRDSAPSEWNARREAEHWCRDFVRPDRTTSYEFDPDVDPGTQ